MEDINIEVWKPVVGYEDLYEVSSIGRINSLISKKILSPIKTSFGHTKIKLCKNKHVKTMLIHRIVALSFLEIVEGKTIVNHINSIPSDNRVENLEWVTVKENVHHAIKHGNMKPEVSNIARVNAKKSRSKKVTDIMTGAIYDSISEAAKANNIKHGTLVDYLLGRYTNKTNLRATL